METRYAKINISAAGGTAGKGAKTCKLTIPNTWVAALGITEDARDIELNLDGDRIIISKPKCRKEFTESKADHKYKTFLYYDGSTLCSSINADFTDLTINVVNHTPHLIKTAFGVKQNPTWEDFIEFLEDRCVPRQRAGIREYLEVLGLEEYDPFEIIRKTKGRMAEDQQWIEVIDA